MEGIGIYCILKGENMFHGNRKVPSLQFITLDAQESRGLGDVYKRQGIGSYCILKGENRFCENRKVPGLRSHGRRFEMSHLSLIHI